MARDETIDKLTSENTHNEQSAAAPSRIPDVATLRAMMHKSKYDEGVALEQ